MVPSHILDQLPFKCSEGLALALAAPDDGAVMLIQWCNKTFTRLMGYAMAHVIDQRGSVLVGPDTEHRATAF